MENIQNLLKQRYQKTPNKRALSYEWQAFAYKIWYDYSGKKNELPIVMKFVKQYQYLYRPLINTAYNFCIDYSCKVPKTKLLFWKFHQLLAIHNEKTRNYLIKFYQGR